MGRTFFFALWEKGTKSFVSIGSLPPHGYDRGSGDWKVTNLQARHASPIANAPPGRFFRVGS